MPDGEAILDGVHGVASRAAKRIMRKDSRPLFVVLPSDARVCLVSLVCRTTHETDRRHQMNQLPAMHRKKVSLFP